jgi:hypothetical protein
LRDPRRKWQHSISLRHLADLEFQGFLAFIGTGVARFGATKKDRVRLLTACLATPDARVDAKAERLDKQDPFHRSQCRDRLARRPAHPAT